MTVLANVISVVMTVILVWVIFLLIRLVICMEIDERAQERHRRELYGDDYWKRWKLEDRQRRAQERGRRR